MEKGNTAFRGRSFAFWLGCLLLGEIAFPEVGGFALENLFQAAGTSLLLMTVGWFFDGKEPVRETLKKCAGALLGYVLIRGAACVGTLVWDVVAGDGGSHVRLLYRWIRDTLWGFCGPREGSVGDAWVLTGLAFGIGLLRLVLLVKNRWMQLLLVLAVGLGSFLLDLMALSLPWSLETAPMCLVFLYGGWRIREDGLLEKLGKPRWLAAFALLWCVAGFDGALNVELKAWPHSFLSLVPAFCGGFLLLAAARHRLGGGKVFAFAGNHFLILFGAYCTAMVLVPDSLKGWTPAGATALRWAAFAALALCAALLRMGRKFWERHWQNVFLGMLMILVVQQSAMATSIGLGWPKWLDPAVRTGLLAMALWRLWQKVDHGKGRQLILPVLLGATFVGAFLNTQYALLLDLVLLIFCAMDVPYKRILRAHLLAALSTFAVIFVSSLLGICPNVGAPRGDGWRFYFGSGGATDFAANLVFLALTYWVMEDRVPSTALILGMAAAVIFQRELTDTRCSELILTIACFGVAYTTLTEGRGEKKLARGLNKTLDWTGMLMMPICAAAIISMSWLYDPTLPAWQRLNAIASGRFALTSDAFHRYGFKLFGTAFDLVGLGMSDSARANYNFVDSSYCLILVRYGIGALLSTLVLCGLVQKKASAAGNRKLVIAFTLIALASVMEHHLTDVFLNPFILLPFADFGSEAQGEKRCKKERIVRGAASLALAAGLALCAPRLILFGQTVVVMAKNSEYYSQWLACGILLAALVLVYQLWRRLGDLVSRWILEGKPRRRECMALGLVLILLAAAVLGAEGILQRGQAGYQTRLEEARKIVSLLEEKDLDCEVLADEVPGLFLRRVPGVSARVLGVSTATDVENGVILTDGRRDYRHLSNAGFVYVPISEETALYTNSPEALELLRELGYPGYPYCNAEIRVDLRDMARRNGLTYTENGTVLLKGEENPMKRGPYLHLYDGTYRVTFRMKVLYASSEEGALGTVETSSEWGTSDLTVVPFTWENVDDRGRVVMAVDSRFPNREQIEFSVRPYGDTLLEVESITYQRIE